MIKFIFATSLLASSLSFAKFSEKPRTAKAVTTYKCYHHRYTAIVEMQNLGINSYYSRFPLHNIRTTIFTPNGRQIVSNEKMVLSSPYREPIWGGHGAYHHDDRTLVTFLVGKKDLSWVAEPYPDAGFYIEITLANAGRAKMYQGYHDARWGLGSNDLYNADCVRQ